MARLMKNPKIPQTDSIDELAKFWDTHDLTDFQDELEEVTEPVFERRTTLSIHLESEDAEAIKRIAQAKGVGSDQLVREWILERVRSS